MMQSNKLLPVMVTLLSSILPVVVSFSLDKLPQDIKT